MADGLSRLASETTLESLQQAAAAQRPLANTGALKV
jgi:hypothetical protein